MSKNKQNKDLKKWLIIGGSLLLVYFLTLFIPFVSPYTKYPLYLVKCGGRPITASKFAAGSSYEIPSEGFNVTPTSDYFYCSESDAKAAGFSK